MDPGITNLFLNFLCNEHLVNGDLLNCGQCHVDPSALVVSSAVSIYFAPSDRTGITGYKRELMRAAPTWRKKSPRHDTILVRTGLAPGPHGLSVAQLRLLFSFKISEIRHSVALVEWFSYIGTSPDEDTGMWVVERETQDDGLPRMDFIFVNAILRSCHLLPIYGGEMVPSGISHVTCLEDFRVFYVNKFADHHSFELLS